MEVFSTVIISAINHQDKYNPKFVFTDSENPLLPIEPLKEDLKSIDICASLIKSILGVSIYDGYGGWVPIHLSDIYEYKNNVVIVYSAMIPDTVELTKGYKWYLLSNIFKNEKVPELHRNIIHKVGTK